MDKGAMIPEKQKNGSKKSSMKKRRGKIDKIKITDSKDGSKTKKKRYQNKARAAIYIGRIPHGFFEDEMNAYFNQFGKVLSTFVARSKRTGRSKGYGFVEFEDEDVAKIAAESMNNYLMFNRVLKCRYIPPEERKGKIFVKTINPILPKVKNRVEDAKKRRNAFAALDQATYQKKTQKKISDFKKFFEDRGIDFSFKVNFVDKKLDKNSNMESESFVSSGSESEDDTDDQFGVLEIDESDNDIHFKTPPQVKKVIKRSFSSSIAKPNSNEEKEKVKYSSLPEITKYKTTEGKKTSKGIGKKLEKKTKAEKALVKSFKPKKTQDKKRKSLKKGVTRLMSEKKGRKKEKQKSVGVRREQKANRGQRLGKAKKERSCRNR